MQKTMMWTQIIQSIKTHETVAKKQVSKFIDRITLSLSGRRRYATGNRYWICTRCDTIRSASKSESAIWKNAIAYFASSLL